MRTIMCTAKRGLPSIVALLCLAAPLVHAAPRGFTIQQVMSAPFASAALAAPTGARVAWLLNEQGHRNLWAAGAPDWKARKLTNFNEDDGQEIDEVVWAPDSSYLLFTRGGDFEMSRENPNPSKMVTKPDQGIWSVSIDGTPAKRLTDGHAPAISSNGALVAFVRAGQIFLMKPSGEGVVSAAVQLGTSNDLTWSPDGSALAFVNSRRDHAFVGIYSVADKAVRYLDPSVDRDESPVWSPDGARLAYIRIPASTRAFSFGPEREGEPWSIRVADLKSGRGEEVFHADPGRGSVFSAAVARKQLFWSSGARLVFPWEKTGWRHLYSVPTAGGTAVDLTPGEGEVEHVATRPQSTDVYFSANFLDIDRRHLWKVSSAGYVAPEQVTKGDEIEWEPAPAADGSALMFLASSYNLKAHAAVKTASGSTQALAPETVPTDFPSADLVKPQQVILTASDGMRIHGQLFLPPGGSVAKHPGLLFFHGGSRRQMLLGFHYMYYYSNSYAMNQYLASQGYVVLSVNYRSGIGYGMNFREALNYGATGASEFNDVTGAALYLKSRPEVDPSRVGLWGGSYGGYLTALGLARASDQFAAGVDFHGVHDWNQVIRNFVEAYDPQTQQDAAKLAFDSSPMASVKTWKSPVLLIHGDDDRNVPFTETIRLVEALRQQHVDFEQLIFPNEIHDFLLHRDWVTAYEATAEFFGRKLKEPMAHQERTSR